LCTTYRTGPRNVATVTREPSAVRSRETVTRGGGAGAVAAAVALVVALRSPRLPVAAGVAVAGAGARAGEVVHPAMTHRPASRPTAGRMCFLAGRLLFTRSRMPGHGEGIVNDASICGILVRRDVVSAIWPGSARSELRGNWEKRMKFLMLVCVEEDRFENEAAAEEAATPDTEDSESFPWLDDVIARGIRLDGDRLRPPREAKTVLVRDGEILVSDGPFAETKEIICGYDVLECADLAEAVQVAAAHPVAAFGKIEVRPFWR
jgi:hypothetical protein